MSDLIFDPIKNLESGGSEKCLFLYASGDVISERIYDYYGEPSWFYCTESERIIHDDASALKKAGIIGFVDLDDRKCVLDTEDTP